MVSAFFLALARVLEYLSKRCLVYSSYLSSLSIMRMLFSHIFVPLQLLPSAILERYMTSRFRNSVFAVLEYVLKLCYQLILLLCVYLLTLLMLCLLRRVKTGEISVSMQSTPTWKLCFEVKTSCLKENDHL